MLMRSALLAAATAIACVSAPALASTSAARCQETSFRVYFSQGSATLDSVTAEMLQAAARSVADCEYRELRVALDAASPYAAQRSAAISALAGDGWDATRIEARGTAHTHAGPDYAEVLVTPTASTAPAQPLPSPAGIGR